MISPATKQHWKLLTVSLIAWLSLPGVCVTGAPRSVSASVGGTVKLIFGDHTFPVAKARLEVRGISDEEEEYDAVTDKAGTYTMDLPQGTYRMRLAWMGGECSTIRRASFELRANEHLAFDFLVMECPTGDPVRRDLPFEGQAAKESVESQNINPMNVPSPEQTEKYQEQLIPAERDHWPEITVSFGKYDNQVNEIRYFPLHQVVINPFAIPDPPIPLSLPVTITVDRYTLRALEVVLDKKKMLFKAKGEVSISDGTTTSTGSSAKLSFSAGRPTLKIKR
jgi:hypothetical protein